MIDTCHTQGSLRKAEVITRQSSMSGTNTLSLGATPSSASWQYIAALQAPPDYVEDTLGFEEDDEVVMYTI